MDEPTSPEPIDPLDVPIPNDDTRRVMVRDPVCGAAVDPAGAADMVQHRGERYYFCSSACREVFEADPARYTGVL